MANRPLVFDVIIGCILDGSSGGGLILRLLCGCKLNCVYAHVAS